MGYYLELLHPVAEAESPGDPSAVEFNGWMMGLIREFLREVGAVRSEPGGVQALEMAGFEPGPLSIPIEWFCHNNGDVVSADQARFMAARVRAGMESEAMDMFGFFDDAPEPAVTRQWLEEFVGLNERAARGSGYRVT